jgi:hypothetical protein
VTIRNATIRDVVPFSMATEGSEIVLLLLRAEYEDGLDSTYLIPLAFAPESEASRTGVDFAENTVARLQDRT